MSTYYAFKTRPPSQRAVDDASLIAVIRVVHEENYSCYGVLKMWRTLRRRGIDIGRDRTARLMRAAGLSGAIRGRHHTITTTASKGAPRHPDLVHRGWDVVEPDRVWVADFTYVWTYQGFAYVAFITDVASRHILGWTVSLSKETTLVATALDQALHLRRRGPAQFTTRGLVHHSDAGSQYTSIALTEQLREAGIAGSIGTVGDALDNALMESTIGLYKTELIHAGRGRTWPSRQAVEVATANWVHWFNEHRLHSGIGYRTPIEYETDYHQNHAQEPLSA
ncbi:IS3 family transposase [Rathayibacter sp. YIM 133350]|uniref:IS3 family transposase n=1 Tax=Rathayibacter sp. YIM 133350 TaxID=3131992 RepID=UPI00307E0C5C